MKRLTALVIAMASFFGLVSTVAAQCNIMMDVKRNIKSATQVELQKEVRNELVNQGLVDLE